MTVSIPTYIPPGGPPRSESVTLTTNTLTTESNANVVSLTFGGFDLEALTAEDGKIIVLRFADETGRVIDTSAGGAANINLKETVDYNPGIDDTLTLACIVDTWWEVARSSN